MTLPPPVPGSEPSEPATVTTAPDVAEEPVIATDEGTATRDELRRQDAQDQQAAPTEDDAIADLAAAANANLENIGARRLMTIVEKVFEQINFDAPEMVARGETKVRITDAFVREQVAAILEDNELSKFVL